MIQVISQKPNTSGLSSKVKAIVNKHIKAGDIIVKMDSMGYSVEGSVGKKYYVSIMLEGDEHSCDCPAFRYGNGLNSEGYCKHVEAVLFCKENGVVIRTFDDIMVDEYEVDDVEGED